MIRRNKVSGGMILKLEASKRALAGGVAEVRIVGGTGPRALAGCCQWRPVPWHARAAGAASSGGESSAGSGAVEMAKKKIAAKGGVSAAQSARRGSSPSDEHVQAAAHGFHARARLPRVRFRRTRISRFSRRHRRERARICASAACSRDSARGGARDSHFESFSQSVIRGRSRRNWRNGRASIACFSRTAAPKRSKAL